MLSCNFLSQLISRYKAAMFTVNRRMTAMMREEMPVALTLEQFSMIQYIGANGPCTSSDLADAFCVGKSSITAIITRLFDKKLIQRKPDEKDRRVIYLHLTEEGKKIEAELDGKIEAVLSRYMGHFEEKEATQFIETYEKLANVLLNESGNATAGEEQYEG